MRTILLLGEQSALVVVELASISPLLVRTVPVEPHVVFGELVSLVVVVVAADTEAEPEGDDSDCGEVCCCFSCVLTTVGSLLTMA